MDITAWVSYLWTLFAVLLTPATSVLLVVSQALRAGRRAAGWTVAGDLAANALQIGVVAVAASAVIASIAAHGAVLKWGAVGFLLLTAQRSFTVAASSSVPASRSTAFLSGFAVSIANPAAIVFFALFLPLFVTDEAPAVPQFAKLGAVALLLDGAILCSYAAAALKIRRFFESNATALVRLAGALRIGAAALLAIAI